LANQDTAYLFPLAAFTAPSGTPELPAGLCSILSDPKILKVGAGIAEDMAKLKQLQHGDRLRPAGIIDLVEVAKRCGILEFGLRGLCALLLGHKLSKTEQLSRWDKLPLTPRQEHYAACDAWVGFRLYEEFVKRDIPALELAHAARVKQRARALSDYLASPVDPSSPLSTTSVVPVPSGPDCDSATPEVLEGPGFSNPVTASTALP